MAKKILIFFSLIILILIGFVLLNNRIEAAHVEIDNQQDSMNFDRPVIFEGVRYEPEEFDHVVANQLQGVDFIIVPNEYLPNSVPDNEEAIYYLFSTAEDMVEFLEQQGVDFSTYETNEDDLSPQEPIESSIDNKQSP